MKKQNKSDFPSNHPWKSRLARYNEIVSMIMKAKVWTEHKNLFKGNFQFSMFAMNIDVGTSIRALINRTTNFQPRLEGMGG